MKIGSMLLIAAGFILLAMGAVGLFLPVWPTTPFVLGAAGCFSGSPKLRAMIMKVGFFREHIENYQDRQGLSGKVVVSSLVFLWGMLFISGIIIQAVWATVLFLFIGTAVTAHILYMAGKRNSNISDKKRFGAIGEAVFDILYLCTGLVVGFYLLVSGGNTLKGLYGIMALVLIFGDSFHLVPRISVGFTGERGRFERQLASGKRITSITMTVFYVLLWHIGLLYFPDAKLADFTAIVYILAVLRVILCLCPQNEWFARQPSARWGIYRNIPFLLLGMMVMVLFIISSNPAMEALRFMGGAVFLSFLFYVPVVLWADRYPAVGMLMLPKTCAYIWIICMGLFL